MDNSNRECFDSSLNRIDSPRAPPLISGLTQLMQMKAQRNIFCLLSLSALFVLLAMTGCKKQEAAPKAEPAPKAPGVSIDAAPSSEPAPANPVPPAPSADAPAADAADQPKTSDAENVEKVQYAYYSYCREHTSPPRDFSVLVAEHYLPALPVAPPGKKFVLDNKNLKVLLVNQ